MWLKWLPWRFIVRKVARQQGFIDPIDMLAKFQNFAQPSDVMAPQELLREGVVLHARGLMNSQAIQHNLDWVWPYWVEKQFDPLDVSFVPRAFSLTQINLTHRNWTAVGIPGVEELPIVDPRGLVTPFYDGWSIDAWVIGGHNPPLIPSRLPSVDQELLIDDKFEVVTTSRLGAVNLTSKVLGAGNAREPVCEIKLAGFSDVTSWLVVSLRPYNPEGVSFIHEIELLDGRIGWKVDKKHFIFFDKPAEQYEFSYYRHGDVYSRLPSVEDKSSIRCKVGMASAAALFKIHPHHASHVTVKVPLIPNEHKIDMTAHLKVPWHQHLQGHCAAQVPDDRFQFLYDAALKTIILHSPREVFPGPFTYRRFWFRDAAFIVNAMLCAGLTQRAETVLECFPERQNQSGYFLSQQGEWDSNGEVLWTIKRYCEMTRKRPVEKILKCFRRAGLWISRKRLPAEPASAHAGLMPAGFSAEHLGPNDYYYWDDFWSVAGLEAASYLEDLYGDKKRAARFIREANVLTANIDESLRRAANRLKSDAMPAAPYRRMDSGAIGSIVAGYPLQLFEPKDPRLTKTVRFLLDQCSIDHGFFHDMTHSGINPYLTLHIAQVLLRAGEPRYQDLMNAVARLASPTGQWPEAIHPRTKGGCMGDGQHVWASAEWVLMMRNCFVREEAGRLILGSGIPKHWLSQDRKITFGPAPTIFGSIHLTIWPHTERPMIEWKAHWFDETPVIEIALPGFPVVQVPEGTDHFQFS